MAGKRNQEIAPDEPTQETPAAVEGTELTEDEVRYILEVLTHQPYRNVVALITKLSTYLPQE